MDIFKDEEDYLFFLSRMKEYLLPELSRRAPSAGAGSARYVRKSLPEGAFTLVAYCLMPNHFHFLIRQNTELSISTLMLGLCGGYSKYFNKKYKRVGSLFQDQFKAVHVDSNEYLLWLSAYIHQNPTIARLVAKLSKYKFSSYPDYCWDRGGVLCDKSLILEQFSNADAYAKFVADSYETIKNRKDLERLLID